MREIKATFKSWRGMLATPAVLAVMAIAPMAQAADAWTIKLTPQGYYSSYSGSPARNYLWSYGLSLDAQYLERGGVSVGAEHTYLQGKGVARSISQDTAFISGHLHLTPDGLPGRLTMRLDGLAANNNDITNESDQVRVWAPQLSFLNHGKTFYLDAGYAGSSYGASNVVGRGSLKARQWTPTVGFALGSADWLQLRLYDVRNTNAVRSSNKSKTTAVEGKWIHYFQGGGWVPEQMQVAVLGGERIYAVDPDTRALYNLADLQKGGVSLGANWKLASNTRLLVNTGYNRYEAVTGPGPLTSTYSGAHIYTGVSFQW